MANPNHEIESEISYLVNATRSPGQQAAIGYHGFASWPDVLEAARRGEPLWYGAPLDRHPRSVVVKKVYKNGKIRIDPMSNQADDFTADRGHLDRFFRRA